MYGCSPVGTSRALHATCGFALSLAQHLNYTVLDRQKIRQGTTMKTRRNGKAVVNTVALAQAMRAILRLKGEGWTYAEINRMLDLPDDAYRMANSKRMLALVV